MLVAVGSKEKLLSVSSLAALTEKACKNEAQLESSYETHQL